MRALGSECLSKIRIVKRIPPGIPATNEAHYQQPHHGALTFVITFRNIFVCYSQLGRTHSGVLWLALHSRCLVNRRLFLLRSVPDLNLKAFVVLAKMKEYCFCCQLVSANCKFRIALDSNLQSDRFGG